MHDRWRAPLAMVAAACWAATAVSDSVRLGKPWSAFAVAWAQAEQEPPRPARPPVKSTSRSKPLVGSASATIRGRVVAADTGDPLRRARVTLRAPTLDRPRSVSTDDRGVFEFRELPKGRYTLTAAKTIYVTMQFGQQRASEEGRPIELDAGASLDLPDLALPRGGVLAGRVVDDLGDPVVAVVVAAMRPRTVDGARRLAAVGRAAETDDRGEYRLFGLPAGTYTIGTLSGSAGGSLPFGPAYFPGTANPTDAELVLVRSGQVRTGIDIALQPTPLSRILGTLGPGRNGELVRNATVRAYSQTGFMSLAGAVQPDGSWLIADAPAGEYAIVVTGHDATGAPTYGFIPVSVTGGDVAGLFVPMTPGGRARGRIVFEGTAKPPVSPASMDIVSQATGPSGFAVGRIGAIRNNWTFELTSQIGPRLIRPSGLPAGWFLKSVALGERDVTDTPLVFDGTEDLSDISVVLTKSTTLLTGKVVGDHGTPVSVYTVIVFAQDRARWSAGSRFIGVGRPDQGGRFTVTGLPPGAYFVVAADGVDSGVWEDPKFLEVLRGSATAVVLTEGTPVTVTLGLMTIGG